MSDKHIVVWGVPGKATRLLPVDEDLLADTVDEAKQAARRLLKCFSGTSVGPVEVMGISEEKHQEYVTGTTPLVTYNQGDESREVEMLVLVE